MAPMQPLRGSRLVAGPRKFPLSAACVENSGRVRVCGRVRIENDDGSGLLTYLPPLIPPGKTSAPGIGGLKAAHFHSARSGPKT